MTDLVHIMSMMDRAEVKYECQDVTNARAWRGWPDSCKVLIVQAPCSSWSEFVFTSEGEFFGINAYAG